jgi:hypothetical protein
MKVKLRTPNELFYDEFDIDPKDFIMTQEFDTDVFGSYRGMTVAMDVESYKKIKNENKDTTER